MCFNDVKVSLLQLSSSKNKIDPDSLVCNQWLTSEEALVMGVMTPKLLGM